jgi:phage tail-like protein
MARPVISDPLRNFKFRVTIEPPSGGTLSTLMDGVANLGFSVVSGLTVQNEMIAYREGGMNTHPHKMVGQSDYGPVTLTKGVFSGQNQLYRWQRFLHTWTQGGTDADLGGSVSGANDYRCDVLVQVFDHPTSAGPYQHHGGESVPTPPGPPKLGYRLYNCWPASFSMGDLNAGDSSILIQQIVLNHEGFELGFTEAEVSAIAAIG